MLFPFYHHVLICPNISPSSSDVFPLCLPHYRLCDADTALLDRQTMREAKKAQMVNQWGELTF